MAENLSVLMTAKLLGHIRWRKKDVIKTIDIAVLTCDCQSIIGETICCNTAGYNLLVEHESLVVCKSLCLLTVLFEQELDIRRLDCIILEIIAKEMHHH